MKYVSGTRPVCVHDGMALVMMSCVAAMIAPTGARGQGAGPTCERTVTADVVALDQSFWWNRLGAHQPQGMMFALREDVVSMDGGPLSPGEVRLRSDKRPRPIVLRMNVGDCLAVNFLNLLDPIKGHAQQPSTRTAAVRVVGLQLVNSILDDGSNVGVNASSLIPPGASATYTFYAEREGPFVLYSSAATTSGRNKGGSLSAGLFGAVNVQPRGAEWYRSQVTQEDILHATTGTTPDGHPILNYDEVHPVGHHLAGRPIFKMLDSSLRIRHSDLNAIITGPGRGDFPPGTYRPNPIYPDRDQSFREFTIIYHDEIEASQAFRAFKNSVMGYTLNSVQDSFAINYGTGGIGAEILANRLGVGPMWDCTECKYEEFFLSSWAIGDPAMVVDIPANVDFGGGGPTPGPKATRALYPDDPSNVHHSYIGDHVKQRILHGGSQEHHIHHLHAHQWTHTPDSDNSVYLDSQSIGPFTSWTLEIPYRGTGNRNQVVGDSIFHCHFYPHFAQGMWSLWRSHDVFEEGTRLDSNGRPISGARALPDAEIVAGTPIPAVVPIPGLVMAPMPGADVDIVEEPGLPGGQVKITGSGNPGYPFFIPGKVGHRPPHPALDTIDDGGLSRHIITGGETISVETRLDFTKELESVTAIPLAEGGEPVELAAMAYHAQRLHASFRTDGSPGQFIINGLPPQPGAPYSEPCIDDAGNRIGTMRTYKAADIQIDAILNKEGWHYPQLRMLTLWDDVASTMSGQRPPEPLFFRANTNDCIQYELTNLVPSIYELDDFQVRTPTDILGQHIHLVKFDVTASDGSGNGWNYEDGSFSPDEVRERIAAIRAHNNCTAGDSRNGTFDCPVAEAHPFFGPGPDGRWMGAQTTVQRWFADDVLNLAGEDRTLRTVFTHDHFGPSTHQQAGLYAGLVIEPHGSTWRHSETGEIMGQRFDGGPTSFHADILMAEPADSYREFLLEFADTQLAYQAGSQGGSGLPSGGGPTFPRPYTAADFAKGGRSPGEGFDDPTKAIDPPGVKLDDEFGVRVCPGGVPPPCPEAVSDEGTTNMSVNYRNEPMEPRLRDPVTGRRAAGDQGDVAHVFRSMIRKDPKQNVQPSAYPPLTAGVEGIDPFTPILRAYENDKVQVRVLVGAHTDLHNFSVHGVHWLFELSDPNSGYRNSQPMGISEHFDFGFTMPPMEGTLEYYDYLYRPDAGTDGLEKGGLWGLVRCYDGDMAMRTDMLTLPNNPLGRSPAGQRVCPSSAPVREYSVTAVTAGQVLPGGTLVYNSRATSGGPIDDPAAMLYVRSEDLDASGKLKPGVPIEPLVLRANAGECIHVTLHNALDTTTAPFTGMNNASKDVGLHAQLVAINMGVDDDGINVGQNLLQTVGLGGSTTYQWYAGRLEKAADGTMKGVPVEFGATNLMPADQCEHVRKGMVGALIIEPEGSTWVEDADSRASATVTKPDGSSFRDFVLMFQDTIRLRSALGFDLGKFPTAINYRTEPMWQRMAYVPGATVKQINNLDFTNSLSNVQVGSDPQTPIFTAEVGMPVRFRLLHPGGAMPHTFHIHGHVWEEEPYVDNSTRIGSNPLSEWKGAVAGHGPTSHLNLVLKHGAGGKFAVAGDYLYRAGTAEEFDTGIWGIFRVTPGPQPCGAGGDCDDGVICTVDSCNPVTGECEHVTNDALCDNATFCDGAEICNAISDCQPGPNPCPGEGCDEAIAACFDNCPTDLAKFDPGVCGCGVADTDTDLDGTADCVDLCPEDPFKIEPGNYGCGKAETGLGGIAGATAATGALILGNVDGLEVEDPTDVWSAGTITVGGQVVIVPRNMMIELPANFLSLQQIFAQAPAKCVLLGESGLAASDECLGGGSGGVATIEANRTAAGDVIAGYIFLEKAQELVSGRVTFINHTGGYFRMNGSDGDDTTGVMIRINDPDGRHTIQSGKGCAGGPNCSADPRYTNDPDNYTVVFTTGYPACLPSTNSTEGTRTVGSDGSGVGDPFCPETNRGSEFAADSSRFAPIQVGDFVNAEGNFEVINGVRFLSAFDVAVNVELLTDGNPDKPDYMTFDEVEWDVAGFQNERAKVLLIGFVTDPEAQLDIFSLHKDPLTGEDTEVPLGSTVGNTRTVRNGVGFDLAGIFKIHYDVDFIKGVPVEPLLSPCTNLRNAGLHTCPIVAHLGEEFRILSPITRELIGKTRHLQARPDVKAFDILGRETNWGRYLNPVSPGHPEFGEIDLNRTATPFIFAGIPWNLDRRLHPGGCVDTDGDDIVDCETTLQPLDPFPFSGLDPRTQALVPVQAADRILSAFGPGGPASVVMPWPPVDPAFVGPVAVGLNITRASFKVEPDSTKIDVWAESQLGGDLAVSGPGITPQVMVGNGAGRYFLHLSLAAGTPAPPAVTVTHTASGRAATHPLSDEVAVVEATFDVLRQELLVTGTTSGSGGGTSLALDSGTPADAAGEILIPGLPVPPTSVTLMSTGGGTETRAVSVNPIGADVITVTSAVYDSTDGHWTISGTSSVVGPGNSVIAYLGAPVLGTVIDGGAVDAAGNWQIVTAPASPADPTAPGAPTTISVQSTPLGGVTEGEAFLIQ